MSSRAYIPQTRLAVLEPTDPGANDNGIEPNRVGEDANESRKQGRFNFD